MPPRKKSQRDRFEELVRKNADVLDEATLARCTKTATQPVIAVHSGAGNAIKAGGQAEAAINPSVDAVKQTGEPPLRWPSWSEGAILQEISGSAAIRAHFKECMVGEVQTTGTSNKEKLSASQVLKVEYDALMLEMGIEERSASPPSSSQNGKALDLGNLKLEDYDVMIQDEVLKGSLSEKMLNEATSGGKQPVLKHPPRPVWGANLPPTNPVEKPPRTRPLSSKAVRSAQQEATLHWRPVSANVTSQRTAPAKSTKLSSVLKEVAAQIGSVRAAKDEGSPLDKELAKQVKQQLIWIRSKCITTYNEKAGEAAGRGLWKLAPRLRRNLMDYIGEHDVPLAEFLLLQMKITKASFFHKQLTREMEQKQIRPASPIKRFKSPPKNDSLGAF